MDYQWQEMKPVSQLTPAEQSIAEAASRYNGESGIAGGRWVIVNEEGSIGKWITHHKSNPGQTFFTTCSVELHEKGKFRVRGTYPTDRWRTINLPTLIGNDKN